MGGGEGDMIRSMSRWCHVASSGQLHSELAELAVSEVGDDTPGFDEGVWRACI